MSKTPKILKKIIPDFFWFDATPFKSKFLIENARVVGIDFEKVLNSEEGRKYFLKSSSFVDKTKKLGPEQRKILERTSFSQSEINRLYAKSIRSFIKR